MNRKIFTAAIACGVLGLVGTSATALAGPKGEPKGNPYGYWAGRLCDHVGPTTDGVTYWESRYAYYEDRGECVEAESESLARGEWNPEDWPL